MTTLNKTELAKILRKHNYKQQSSEDVADIVIEAIGKALSSGHNVSFRNVLSLRKTARQERYVPKPNSTQKTYVPAHWGYRLVLPRSIKRQLNSK